MQSNLKLNIFRYTWPGLLLLNVVTILLLTVNLYMTQSSGVKKFDNFINKSVHSQQSAFKEESYLFQVRSISKRIQFLYDDLIRSTIEFESVCFKYDIISKLETRTINFGKCYEDFEINKNFKFKVGGVKVGNFKVSYRLRSTAYYLKKYIEILLLSFAISLVVYYLFTIIITKRVIKPYFEKVVQLSEKEAEYVLTRQVAHDIRSPLEALKSVSNGLDELDYTTKKIIQASIVRISDIANGLLKNGQNESDADGQLINLGILIDDLIVDKNFEKNINIKFENKAKYRDLFFHGNETEIYRSISNLINNAIEAQSFGDEIVEVKLSYHKNIIKLLVIDYGKGMSEELLEKVLLGGITTKVSGNGLGLAYAKASVEKSRGRFAITSKLTKGTEVKITFRSEKTPEWFSDSIEITENVNKIICIDDDLSFLELHKEKLSKLNKKLLLISNVDRLTNFEDNSVLYLVDFDLGHGENGLKFISENKIADKSILVTSMYQDQIVIDKAIELGIKIIPKQIYNKCIVNCENSKIMNLDVSISSQKSISLSQESSPIS